MHTSRDPRAVTSVGIVLTTDLADTVADLARALPPASALAVVDAGLSPVQGGSLELDGLRAMIASRVDRRHTRRLDWVPEHADGDAESPTESISRAVMAWSGFERPSLQREFRYEGANDRVDSFFASTGTIGEADGWGKYDLDDPDAAARRLRDEKRREDRLRRHGHPFARWDLRDAARVDPLCRALSAAGVPVVRAAQPAMLGDATIPSACPLRHHLCVETPEHVRFLEANVVSRGGRGFSGRTRPPLALAAHTRAPPRHTLARETTFVARHHAAGGVSSQM